MFRNGASVPWGVKRVLEKGPEPVDETADNQSLSRRTVLARMAAGIPAAAVTAPLAAAEHDAPELVELFERWQAEKAARVSLDPTLWEIGPVINGRSYSGPVANSGVGRRMDWISLDFTLC